MSELRAAAQAVVDAAETDDDFDGQFIDWMVPDDKIAALRAALAAPSTEPALDVVRAALTDEDEVAHGEAVRGGDTRDPRAREGVGVCAYCDSPWPCRTQRGIDRLLARLAESQP